jgi:hypothetical protein
MAPADSPLYPSSPGHPSPGRESVRLELLFFGLCAAPIAWTLQFLINYGLASHACYPRDMSQPEGGLWYGPLAINLVAILVSLAAAIVSYAMWRSARREHSGASGQALEVGEGRTRFMALLGMMTGLGFLFATICDTVVLLVERQCG